MACALFAAISGSSPATVMAVGSILIPAMVKQGYPPQFGVGSIATAVVKATTVVIDTTPSSVS